MLFLDLKKLWVVKIIPCQIPTTRENKPGKFPIPPTPLLYLENFGKGLSLLKFVYLFQVKFNFLLTIFFSE